MNLANIQDSLRIYEQSAINQSKEGAWRVATPEEKAVFCNADNSTQAFVYEGLDKEHSTWDCNYNMPQSFFSTSKLPQIACQVFNRYFIRFESPATLVCGEPVEENKLEKEKQKA